MGMTIVYFSIENLKAMVKVCGIGIFKWGSQSGAGSRRPGPSHIPRSWIQHCHTLQCNTLSHIVTHCHTPYCTVTHCNIATMSHIVTAHCITLLSPTLVHHSAKQCHKGTALAPSSGPSASSSGQAAGRQGRHCQPNIDNSRPCVTVCAVNIDK